MPVTLFSRRLFVIAPLMGLLPTLFESTDNEPLSGIFSLGAMPIFLLFVHDSYFRNKEE